jgi:hypothetical protein
MLCAARRAASAATMLAAGSCGQQIRFASASVRLDGALVAGESERERQSLIEQLRGLPCAAERVPVHLGKGVETPGVVPP